jgi:drug/metabolite transporter (DMT)-like permease
MNWLYSILIGTCFFIGGQLFLRKTFEGNSSLDYFNVSLWFSFTIGILSFFALAYEWYQEQLTMDNRIWNPILAGALFFIGFFFWIATISSKESLGMIRVAMAGFETVLLFLLSYLFFNDAITYKQMLGSVVILIGIGIATII